MKNETGTSAARVSRLLEYMEREGAVRVGEIPALLHVSTVTAGRYAAALRACPWVTFGREYACETERDRKLRLSPLLCFCVLSLSRTQVRVMRYCPATGEVTRQSHALCDAIPSDEALGATFGRVLGTMSDAEKQPAFLGLLPDGDVVLPASMQASLSVLPMDVRETLTLAALTEQYGAERILYVHVGDVPTMRYVHNGVSMPDLRPSEALQREWPLANEARVCAIVKHAAQALSVLPADRVILEADGGASAWRDAVMRQAQTCGVALPPVEALERMSLAEREMIARLRYRLAEQILK